MACCDLSLSLFTLPRPRDCTFDVSVRSVLVRSSNCCASSLLIAAAAGPLPSSALQLQSWAVCVCVFEASMTIEYDGKE